MKQLKIKQMDYTITITCKNCHHQTLIKVSKQEAAFDLMDTHEIWNSRCTKCNSIEKSSVSINKPTID